MAKTVKRPAPKGWKRPFIKERRELARVGQEELAGEMGISVPYLSQLESGKRRYNQDMLERAAEALGCDPADLLRRPSDDDKFRSLFSTLSEEQRAHMAEIAKTFKR